MEVIIALWTNNYQMEGQGTNMEAFFQIRPEMQEVGENDKTIFLVLLLAI